MNLILACVLSVPIAVVGDRIMDPDFRRRVRARLRARRVRAQRPMVRHWEQALAAARKRHLSAVAMGYSGTSEHDVIEKILKELSR